MLTLHTKPTHPTTWNQAGYKPVHMPKHAHTLTQKRKQPFTWILCRLIVLYCTQSYIALNFHSNVLYIGCYNYLNLYFTLLFILVITFSCQFKIPHINYIVHVCHKYNYCGAGMYLKDVQAHTEKQKATLKSHWRRKSFTTANRKQPFRKTKAKYMYIYKIYYISGH